MENKREKLISLLKQVSKSHHDAFVDSDGKDDNWARWYAEYLVKHGVEDVLNLNYDLNKLIDLLKRCDSEYAKLDSNQPWEVFYADFIIDNDK